MIIDFNKWYIGCSMERDEGINLGKMSDCQNRMLVT